METQTIVVPEAKSDMILRPEIVYQVPDTVWVMEATTHELLNQSEVTVQEAMRVILIPKIAGG